MYICKTLSSKAKPFRWDYNLQDGVSLYRTFSNASEVKTIFSNEELRQIKDRFFTSDHIYLANNVEKLRNGTEFDGLGRFAVTSQVK